VVRTFDASGSQLAPSLRHRKIAQTARNHSGNRGSRKRRSAESPTAYSEQSRKTDCCHFATFFITSILERICDGIANVGPLGEFVKHLRRFVVGIFIAEYDEQIIFGG
jgi:hypothetical protein